MLLYETLILAAPEITTSETSDLEGFFEKTLKKTGASVRSFERWGKYRLAYPVTKREYGVYFLVRYEVDRAQCKELMQEIHNLFTVKLPQTVMRYMTTRLDAHESIAYQKPESLEDAPAGDVDTFIRENKMEGFLKKSSSHQRYERKAHSADPSVVEKPTQNEQEDYQEQ